VGAQRGKQSSGEGKPADETKADETKLGTTPSLRMRHRWTSRPSR